MQIQSSLFYDKKYDILIDNLKKSSEPFVSKSHNIAIAKFLHKEINPLSSLEEIEKKIKENSIIQDSWPLHPSWPLIQYHKSLFFFNIGNEIKCFEILENIWEHSIYINNYLLLFISILTQEFCIRHNNFKLAEKANHFLKKKFSSDQAVSEFLKSRISNANVIKSVVDKIHFNSSRLKLAISIHEDNNSSVAFHLDSLDKLDKKKNTSLNQILSLSSGALYQRSAQKNESILSSASNQQECSILNNRGVIEFQQKRYSSALLLFSKALSTSKDNKFIHPYQHIIYNIGLSHLQTQKPKKAFRYFYSVIPSIPHFPYLWLRLAECCVLFFKQQVAKLRRKTQISSVIAKKLSTVTKTFVILPSSDSKLFSRYSNLNDPVEKHLTLEFAEKCVRNAIDLLQSSDEQSSIKTSATLLYEYICLELGDWSETYKISKPILTLKEEPLIKFLSRIYASQALYMLHDYNEACRILKPCLIEVQLNKNNESAITLYQTAWRVFQANADLERSMVYMNKSLELDSGCREVVLTRVADELRNKRFQPALAALEAFCTKEE